MDTLKRNNLIVRIARLDKIKKCGFLKGLFLVKILVCVHIHIQGVSKRLLKVRVSITSIFYGAEDLKFCTNKLQNYTI